MNSKIMALIAAVCVFAGAFAVISADDSEAATAGQMNVYIYDGSEWTDYVGMPGYNALQALQATGETIVADTDYILEKENEWGPYTEMNGNYGDVTSIGGVTEDASNVWNVFIYNDGWSVGIDAIGYITPFTDGAAPSANIVLYYGADTETVPTSVSSHVTNLASLINPVGNEDYMVEFYLKIDALGYSPYIANGTEVTYYDENINYYDTKTLTASDLYNGITIVGYGSNAYAALKNAVGADNIDATEVAGPYYGWLNTLFNMGTISGMNYTYWVQNGVWGNDATYLSYNLGAYSPLDNAPTDGTEEFTCTEFQLIYSEYSFS